jgi:hypothetical protein
MDLSAPLGLRWCCAYSWWNRFLDTMNPSLPRGHRLTRNPGQSIPGRSTHMILEAAPVRSPYARTPARPSTGHCGTMPGSWAFAQDLGYARTRALLDSSCGADAG